jgi:hypothetical protein
MRPVELPPLSVECIEELIAVASVSPSPGRLASMKCMGARELLSQHDGDSGSVDILVYTGICMYVYMCLVCSVYVCLSI